MLYEFVRLNAKKPPLDSALTGAKIDDLPTHH